jgi:hypothetical protein
MLARSARAYHGDTHSGGEVHEAAMRPRSHRQNLVVWSSSAGPAGSHDGPRFTRSARPGPLRRWIRTGTLLALIGLMGLARAVRTRPAARLALAGVVLTIAGIVLPSGVTLIAGMLVLLRAVAVTLGVSQLHRRLDGERPGAADFFGFGTPPDSRHAGR